MNARGNRRNGLHTGKSALYRDNDDPALRYASLRISTNHFELAHLTRCQPQRKGRGRVPDSAHHDFDLAGGNAAELEATVVAALCAERRVAEIDVGPNDCGGE
jgi:hypothetical protein